MFDFYGQPLLIINEFEKLQSMSILSVRIQG